MTSEPAGGDAGEYDYIVVGAGSSGCVVASRLTERPDIRVLLIEAGPPDDHPLIPMPKGFTFLTRNQRYAWNFTTEPQPHRGFGPEMWPRGRMLGGSSSINGMLYTRGHPQDYEAWVAAGAAGWGAAEALRCFQELEDHGPDARGSGGVGGPQRVSAGARRSDMSDPLIEAGVQMGLPRSEEFFAPTDEMIGYASSTSLRGRRFSAVRAHLRRAMKRPNLKVITDTEVARVLFEDGRAIGVRGRGPGGDVIHRARREVIVCAGTILSPKLLMHSGIGDGAALQALGIDVLHHNPHVGAHLRDHVGVSIPYRLTGARGLNHMLRWPGLAYSLLRYLLFRDGVLATAGDVGAFLRVHPQASRPDAQVMFLSLSMDPPRPGRFFGEVERLAGFSAMGCVVNATSEGSVTLASPDPYANPRIQPNFLTTAQDRETLVEMVKAIRRLVGQPALAGLVGEARSPWADARSDEEIMALCLKSAFSYLHAVGTCRMGREGEAVLDERLRVYGVSGLRVVDCSVMPTLPAGNTNGPAQMAGWRAAELILEDRDRTNAAA